jgi:hypothetical protein
MKSPENFGYKVSGAKGAHLRRSKGYAMAVARLQCPENSRKISLALMARFT